MTAQFGESLHYDGREMSMATHPLGDYFALGGVNPGFGLDWPMDCTALWRGYIGSWEIVGGRWTQGRVPRRAPAPARRAVPGLRALPP